MNLNFHDVLIATEQLAGFLIVMLVLVLLWGLTASIGWLFTRGGVSPQKPPTGAPSASVAPTADDPSEEDVVVIAAAVAMMIDGGHRLVSVQPLPSSWSQQGRRDIHASHRIR